MKFEIKKTEYVNRTFRIPKNLAEILAVKSQNAGVSANEFVIQAIQFAIENLDEPEKNTTD